MGLNAGEITLVGGEVEDRSHKMRPSHYGKESLGYQNELWFAF